MYCTTNFCRLLVWYIGFWLNKNVYILFSTPGFVFFFLLFFLDICLTCWPAFCSVWNWCFLLRVEVLTGGGGDGIIWDRRKWSKLAEYTNNGANMDIGNILLWSVLCSTQSSLSLSLNSSLDPGNQKPTPIFSCPVLSSHVSSCLVMSSKL